MLQRSCTHCHSVLEAVFLLEDNLDFLLLAMTIIAVVVQELLFHFVSA